MHVVTNLDDVGTMLRKRGLQPGGRVQQLLTNEVARYCDPYVPMQSGILKNTRIIKDDGIIFNGPYAKFHYYGKVMVGIISRSAYAKSGEKKEVIDKDLKHHGAPKRGPFWDRRMWKDKKHIIVRKLAKEAGGTAK